MEVLTREQWSARAQAHRARAEAATSEHLARRRRGEKHPVWDFLFDYYGFPPAQLSRWHPGPGVGLIDAEWHRGRRWYSTTPLADEGWATPTGGAAHGPTGIVDAGHSATGDVDAGDPVPGNPDRARKPRVAPGNNPARTAQPGTNRTTPHGTDDGDDRTVAPGETAAGDPVPGNPDRARKPGVVPGYNPARTAQPGTSRTTPHGTADGDDRTVEPGGVAGAHDVTTLDCAAFVVDRGDGLRFAIRVLEATDSAPARYDCFGLHEWAMVYRLGADEVRHTSLPLRLGTDGTDAVVEAHELRCSHFDAFRFFTPDAVPRNWMLPLREAVTSNEQPGCLHGGVMDLYRWAFKLAAAVPGELLLDCFELARKARLLDMRSSPYDVSSLGMTNIPIETPAGKAEHVELQRDLTERARPLRRRLLSALRTTLELAGL